MRIIKGIPWSKAVVIGALTALLSGAATPPAPRAARDFTVVDVFVTTTQPMAAWQVELSAQHEGVTLVGVENGEAASFEEAPRYDPAALTGGRIILAAFTLAKEDALPRGRTRVATLHVRHETGTPVHFDQRLIALANADGNAIEGTLSVEGR